jgi:mitogen-activated protein kinase kinase
MGTNSTPHHDGGALQNGRPPPPKLFTTNINNSNSGTGDMSAHSRSGSFTIVDGKASAPGSASSSSYSALSFAMAMRQNQQGTPDPSSAISSVYSERGGGEGGEAMQREGSMNGLLPDLEKLSLEKGRPLDVEDLDDDGWRAASEQGKIVELGSLGEGAGGAVTRCLLKGGSTVFALKVCVLPATI